MKPVPSCAKSTTANLRRGGSGSSDPAGAGDVAADGAHRQLIRQTKSLCNEPDVRERMGVNHFTVDVRISPRPGLLDPEGKAIHHALHSLSFAGVEDVRVGKLLRLTLTAPSADEARKTVEEMCRKLLANPVTEDFDIVVNGRA